MGRSVTIAPTATRRHAAQEQTKVEVGFQVRWWQVTTGEGTSGEQV